MTYLSILRSLKRVLRITYKWVFVIIIIYASHRFSFEREKEKTNTISVIPVTPETNQYGKMGEAVHLPVNLSDEVKSLIDKGWKDNAFNQYVSDLISLHRSLPDPRDAWCKEPDRFLKKLPATDVIICFHNEAWSTLLRTVHSVLDRSPPELIGEIILVDDFSNMREYKSRQSWHF